MCRVRNFFRNALRRKGMRTKEEKMWMNDGEDGRRIRMRAMMRKRKRIAKGWRTIWRGKGQGRSMR